MLEASNFASLGNDALGHLSSLMVFKQVALFAESFGVEVPVRVDAIVSFLESSILMVAVPTHPASIVLRLRMRTVPDNSSGFGKNSLLLGFAVYSDYFKHKLSIVFNNLVEAGSGFGLVFEWGYWKRWFLVVSFLGE